MQITDTQTLNSEYGFPTLYNNLCNWVVNNIDAYNVKMVVHTGDIVNDNDVPSEWQTANTAMNILVNNNVPYVWCAGNHDQPNTDGWSPVPNGEWVGNQYAAFNPENFRSKSYWAGDYFNGKDNAVKFSVGNYNFMVIDIECAANDATLNWMKGLIEQNPNYNIIVATHAYLNAPDVNADTDDGLWAWEQSLTDILDNYPNVFMTLNGHASGYSQTAQNWFNTHRQNGNRMEIEFDLQESYNRAGADSARIYTFNLNNKNVDVSTYSDLNSVWLTSSDDEFSFTANIQPSNNPTATPFPTWGGIIIPTDSPSSTPIPTVGVSLQGGVSFNLPLMFIIIVVAAIGIILVTTFKRKRYK